jgi:methionyl-tRNA formyltransferase
MSVSRAQQAAPLQVYFFTSRSDSGFSAFQQASTTFAEVDWRLFHIESPADRSAFENQIHSPDVVISFLNPYVIPAALLDQVGGRAFNVHPALPEYPGRDPEHFAFYDGATTTGATLHRMDTAVDSGEIIDIRERSLDRAAGVMRFVKDSELLSIDLLIGNLPEILNGTVKSLTTRTWRPGLRSTRKQFLEMCRIDPSMAQEEVDRRIASFFNPNYRSIYLELHGHRFVYEPPASP